MYVPSTYLGDKKVQGVESDTNRARMCTYTQGSGVIGQDRKGSQDEAMAAAEECRKGKCQTVGSSEAMLGNCFSPELTGRKEVKIGYACTNRCLVGRLIGSMEE